MVYCPSQHFLIYFYGANHAPYSYTDIILLGPLFSFVGLIFSIITRKTRTLIWWLGLLLCILGFLVCIMVFMILVIFLISQEEVMKKLMRCLFIVCILCFSISPVYARAGGGGSSGGGGGGSSGSSSHGSPPVRRTTSPQDRVVSLITFSFISYGFSYMKKYRRRYKAISMHKDMKKELEENNNSFFDEKKMNKVVADYYYTIQNAWNDRDMDTLKQCLSPTLYDQWQTKLNWWEYEGIRNELSDIRLLKTMVVEVGDDYFWSYIEGKMRDRMIKGNEVTQDNKEIFIEYWRFIVEDDRIYLDEIRQEDEV